MKNAVTVILKSQRVIEESGGRKKLLTPAPDIEL
jgi:hypothetical protein